MREFVLLDSGPLGHACRRPGTPGADQCLLWIDALIARGVEVVVSEIADYEVRRAGPPRHFFLSFLRFSIVTNYCTCRLYLLIMTKATANIVKRCDDVPQKLRFSPNAGFAICPSSPILMRWPCQPRRAGNWLIVGKRPRLEVFHDTPASRSRINRGQTLGQRDYRAGPP